MIVSSLFFATMGALVKRATARLPATEVVFFRFLISVVVLLPWMLHNRISVVGRHQRLLVLRSFCGFVAGCLSFVVTSRIPLAESYILTSSSPIFVAVLSAFFLKEVVSTRLFSCVTMAAIGAGFVAKPQFRNYDPAILLGLASAVFSAFAYLGIKKLHRTESSLTIVFHYSAFSVVASALIFGHWFVVPTATEAATLIAAGLFGTSAQLLMTHAYKYQEAAKVSPYSYSTILFSALLGALFWNELPDRWTLFGGFLMILGGVLILKSKASSDGARLLSTTFNERGETIS